MISGGLPTQQQAVVTDLCATAIRKEEPMLSIKQNRKIRSITQRMHRKSKPEIHSCNLCRQTFEAKNRYQLFCEKCRSENELFRFSEWLPNPSDLGLVA